MNHSPLPTPGLPEDLWQSDESLAGAARLIERSAGRVQAVAFDFFDTLVWRLTAKPTDVFNEVALRLAAEKLLPDSVTPADYQVLRRHAEIRTRERQKLEDPTCEDINLNAIYQQLKLVVKDLAAAARIEHAAECDLCQINPVMAGFIRHLRARGLKVLIISDIYFSAGQLRDILRASQFDPEMFELVLTSSDEGLCKGSGNLFRRALQRLNLEAGAMVHVGDNFQADVTGARKAGVRGCHYLPAAPHTKTILDRERFLLGGQPASFSINSLRMLAARLFPGDTDEGFYGQAGTFLMGPVLTRFAGWACDQYLASGVRKVGALMREGELFGQLLQREADARGCHLEITPLYVNRRSTDLAAIGRLTAENLIAWLEARATLPVKTICAQFGLVEAEFRDIPFSPDEKADQPGKVIRLAQFLFTPKIARRIEAKSAEERRKLVDYLRPWLEGGEPFGVCDIGYNASAQTQLKRILELEKMPTPMVGCYLVSYERAADRILNGVDIRHFLGAFGHPDFYYNAFLRSPAYMEQSIIASTGTTLGYERRPDGSVIPVLERMPFDAATVRRQQAFKRGVLGFQQLWHWASRQRPGLLDGRTEFSRRILAGVDGGNAPILARATAFPLQLEVERFGTLALDDHYYADAYKPLCGEQDLATLRKNGFARTLGETGIHWPHGVFHKANPSMAKEFFSFARSLLLCNTEGDDGGVTPDLTVILPSGRNPGTLREFLTHLKATSNGQLRLEVILLVPKDDREMFAAAYELGRQILPVRIYEPLPNQTPIQQMNCAADGSSAPFLLFADEGVRLPAGWDGPLFQTMRAAPEIAAVLPVTLAGGSGRPENPAAAVRCLLVRRNMFAEGLGLNEELSPAGACWNLLMQFRALDYLTVRCPAAAVELRPAETAADLPGGEREILARNWPDFEVIAADFTRPPAVLAANPREITVDWIGSFLDHGSLSHVNRELTAALKATPGIRLHRLSNGAPVSPGWELLARELSASAAPNAAVTVRHAWPPDWQRPQNGKLVVIQPWEFGALPEQWAGNSAGVDEFWVPSDYVRRVYIESGVPAAKVVVVPNGVKLEKFHPQAAPASLATQKKFKFLFVGGTIFRKGPDLLLQAYLANFTAADDVCLVIKDFGGRNVYAGQTFEGKIRAAQSSPNAPEILYLNEEMPADALPGLYTACDCLVLPYRGEGFGLPVLEAMACGRPVIVTAGGATDDFVRDEFAWRVPAERRVFGGEISGLKLTGPGWLLEPNVEVLGQCLRTAFANPAEARRRGLLAARHAVEFCSWQHAAALAAERLRHLGATGSPVVAAVSRPAPVAPVKITLPPCALTGHLAEAYDLVRQKKFRAAWESVRSVLALRPFHPEAGLLLAEIALGAGDGQTAKVCAEHVRRLAPGWKPAKKFLNQRLKSGVKFDWLKVPELFQTSGEPRLSVCLIVRNEEKFLAQCLRSVQGLAAQIVVVDTGSTDRTVEIAREFGAEIREFIWCDDFSAARNAALEQATGDWVLMLDADEELAADSREKLLQAMRDPAVMAWRLPMVDVGREAEGYSYVPRLFRNAPGLFYIGRVHEQVFSSVEVRRAEWGLENRIGEAVLIHHGYTAELTRDRNKIERNLRLLERALEEFPGEPHLLMNLGLELSRSGRAEEALVRYHEAFNQLSAKPAAEIVPELRETLLAQLCTRLTAARQLDEVVRVLTSPLAGMSGGLTASLHFSLGLAQLELKRFSEAANQLRQCLARRDQRSHAPINKEINTAAPHHCLALALVRAGDLAAAEPAFQAGLKETGHGEALRLDYARFLAGQSRPLDALQILNEVVSSNALNTEAWQLGGQLALSRPEFLEFARDWTGEAMLQVSDHPVILAQRAETLMLSEATAEALELWERVWDQAPQPAVLAALILCETVESPSTHAPQSGPGEAAASRAFIDWYRKLLAVKAHQTVVRLNEQMEKLARALPGAAQMLESAMDEASQTVVAEPTLATITATATAATVVA